MGTGNDRIFVSTSYLGESVEVSWAAADSGIYSPEDRGAGHGIAGELLVHMDGIATIKFWDHDEPYVIVIDPERTNGSYVTVYASEDQPPDEGDAIQWQS